MANVIDPVCRNADSHPESVALRGGSEQWTYRQLRDASLGYAQSLAAAGVDHGDRVLLTAPSVPEFVMAYMGIQAAGAVVVPINTMATEAEISHVLTDAGCRLAVAWHVVADATAAAAANHDIPSWILEPGQSKDAAPTVTPVDRLPHDTTAILYTSGTTGRPKGAELTVENLLSAGEIGAECSRGTREDRSGTALPLFHVFGQASVMMPALTAGGSLSLLAHFDMNELLAMLREHRITHTAGVPTIWNALLHAAADTGPQDFPDLTLAVSGGDTLPGKIARAFEERFGCTLREGYGLTETAAYGTFNQLHRDAKLGHAGSASPRTEVEVRDTDGKPCPQGAVGEVFIKGPTVMKGYWNRPRETAEVLGEDGWFRTGDLGQFDADGYLRIVDRIKELIIRGGYNVYPSEVEEVLYAHPDVVEAAVVGVPDEHYGQEVAAMIVARPGSNLTEAQVSEWSRERLSAYKIPRVITFVDTLVKGPSGKVLKRAIDTSALRLVPLRQP
ncbi:class I adenylate-forming enzyme family protein [Stackebrandtia nassauensis]|uniref:AMP-dependent synthetase and ligase n=1 Tax=Stackebrandtia nassauensis (strain DSM 44728 / CIP 108903 / NRRL B-16338 / NBRC 102104 / LLR-40K-21) TaxID=446470 RepID=D3Q998_STANL|nr:AMP-binding protein [Stackebrandtia nassauensis]ADD42580.1 AMP-dependent synthetase and ligase [Stackebrandtia nassauensis DSM 44728]